MSIRVKEFLYGKIKARICRSTIFILCNIFSIQSTGVNLNWVLYKTTNATQLNISVPKKKKQILFFPASHAVATSCASIVHDLDYLTYLHFIFVNNIYSCIFMLNYSVFFFVNINLFN